MTDLIVVPQPNPWLRLKSLVLDSVSSPITKRVYNLGLDEFFAWYGRGATARLHQGHRQRLARCAGGPRARVSLHQRPDHRRPQAGGRGGRQRAAGAGTGRRHHAREGRQVQGRSGRELAVAPAGAEAPERAGRHHQEGTARPRDARRAAGLRAAPVRSGRAHDEAHPAAGQPLVHRGSCRQARARAHDPDADLGEGGDRCLDGCRRHGEGHVLRPVNRGDRTQWRPAVREGRLAASPAVRSSRGSARNRTARLAGASCAKMCRAAGGELEQIQLLLGHASVQTTERYLGTKQDLVHAPNDGIKLRVAV